MRRSQTYKLIPTPEQLAARFLGDVLAAAAGIKPGTIPLRDLGEFAADERHGGAHDRLFGYFDSFKPYRRSGDFQRPEASTFLRPLQLHIDPHFLHGHFRAWLRSQGIDPDTMGT